MYSNAPGKGGIMVRFISRIRKKQRAQAMVEFALTLPVFLLAVWGVIELSRFFLAYSSVYTASREASRFASSVGELGEPNYLQCAEIANVAVDMGFFGGVNFEDVIIFYESSPGVITGSCFRIADAGKEKFIALKGNCYDGSITCSNTTPRYQPAFGDRVQVQVETLYKPIVGIVPEMPVKANNGRTIMMEIKRTPVPMIRELCADYVHFKQSGLQVDPSDSSILYIEVLNESSKSNFIVFAIENIDWNSKYYDEVILETINWDGNPIWLNEDGQAYELPPITIIEESFYAGSLRNLLAKETIKLEFDFSDKANQSDFNLTFDLVLQNASLPTDYCDPVAGN
ncbi:MAG: hypothetical protein CVU41_16485 [Chloroflexi bacterium HGW-Chloroflexi-3]|nr:MAG: hypothetical protein CVU41_16485 [Chloroflexi bacterium HGW-Chloroflexi-3]